VRRAQARGERAVDGGGAGRAVELGEQPGRGGLAERDSGGEPCGPRTSAS
jgi:hypothetical protein